MPKLRNILFGTHLVRILGAKILNFLLFLLKIAKISWFHALFSVLNMLRRFESLLSDNYK